MSKKQQQPRPVAQKKQKNIWKNIPEEYFNSDTEEWGVNVDGVQVLTPKEVRSIQKVHGPIIYSAGEDWKSKTREQREAEFPGLSDRERFLSYVHKYA